MNDELYDIIEKLRALYRRADASPTIEENKAAALVNALTSAINALEVARFLAE